MGISSRPARKSKLLERHDLRFRAQAGLASTIEAVVQFLNDPAAPRYGVVLEDDTALATGFARKLNARLQTTPVEWDVLHLCSYTYQWTALPGYEHVASHGPVVGAPWPQRRDRNWRAKIFYTPVPAWEQNVAQAGQDSLELFCIFLACSLPPRAGRAHQNSDFISAQVGLMQFATISRCAIHRTMISFSRVSTLRG